MAIRKKDGSTYKLVGPNPMLVGQERWDEDAVFRIHNFEKYNKEVYEIEPLPEEKPVKSEQDNIVVVERKPLVEVKPIEQPLKQEPNEEAPKPKRKKKSPVVEEPVVVDGRPKSPYRSYERVLFYCLPAKIEEIFDELYREKRTHVAYNSPFKFAGTIVKSDDVYFMVWTTVDKLSKYSIIYHPEHRRWWKVGQVIADPSGDGLLVHCSISDLEPDFSSLGRS